MVLEELRKLTVNELISRLHSAITSVAQNITKITEKNREITLVDIIELRNGIKQKLDKGEETAENTKLLKLITLFKEDKNALELLKIDLNEWIEFLDAVKEHVGKGEDTLSKEELKEIDKLKTDITKIQNFLRKQ